MRIAYWTTDLVNLDLARSVTDEHDDTLILLDARDRHGHATWDAVVYDLDYLDPEHVQEILAHLLVSPLPCVVAVHSYHLSETHAMKLRAVGVFVHRQPEPDIFRQLRQAVREGQRPRVNGKSTNGVAEVSSNGKAAPNGNGFCSGDGKHGEETQTSGVAEG